MIKIDDIISINGDQVNLKPNNRGFLPYVSSFKKPPQWPYTLAANTTIPPPLTIQGPSNNPDYGANQMEYMVFADATDGASAAWTLQLKDFCGRELMNRPIHIRAIAGTAQQPALIYEPLFVKSRETIYVQLQKLTGGTASIFFYMPGLLYDPQSAIPNQKEIEDYVKKRTEFRKYVYPYWQTTETDVVLTSNSTNNEFDIMMGENFEAFNITAVSTGNFAFKLTDVRSGQELMNGKVTQTNGMGNAQNPFKFNASYLILAGTRLRYSFDDLSGSTNTIYIAMQGRRINAPVADFKEVTQRPMWMQNNIRNGIMPEIVGNQ